MKHLTILVPTGDGNNLSSIVGPFKIFSRANAIYKQRYGREVFKIELVGVNDSEQYYGGLFSVQPQKTIHELKKTDLIIIPSLNHSYEQAVDQNAAIVNWLDAQYHQGAEVASICTGAFLLAAAGLLDGKTCSTHWSAASDFKERFPAVDLQIDQIITDAQGIYTNGGAYSFLNLIIYLVEKFYDRSVAILCAKIFQIEMDRNSQSSFAVFTGQKAHEDDIVRQVQLFMEEHFMENFSLGALAGQFAVSRRNFDRRFLKATGNTPLEYLQRIRVESAKKMLESTPKNVTEVMYEVGYSDVTAFRAVFKRITGLTPIDYRGRYHKIALI